MLEALKTDGNQEQIQEYLSNMKTIFGRMEFSRGHQEQEQPQEEEAARE